MSKTKELIICVISIVVLMLSIATNVFATGAQDINSLLGSGNNNQYQTIPEDASSSGTTSTTTPSTSSTPSTPSTSTVQPTNKTNNNVNQIPYTGVNNYSVIVIIAVAGIIAVYAYKKIKDYTDVK